MIELASKSLLAIRICTRYRDTRGSKGRCGRMVVVGATPAGYRNTQKTMGTRTWVADYQGQRIVVTSHMKWFPPKTWECLQLPGQKERRQDGSLLRMSATMFGELGTNEGPALVEVRFAQVIGSLRSGCHIFVNGALVGGDVDKAINYPDPSAWEETRRRGMLRFVAQRGVLRMGFPYAFLMILVNQSSSSWGKIGQFAFYALGFGGIMGFISWRMVQSQRATRERELSQWADRRRASNRISAND